MRLSVSLYTIGVMCFLRIELLLVVTVYVYPCDVPYLVICLICDGGYHMVSYTNIGNVMSSIYVCTSLKEVSPGNRGIDFFPKLLSLHTSLSLHSQICHPTPPPPPFSPDQYSDSPPAFPQCVCMCVCGWGEVQLRPGLVRGGRWIGGSGGALLGKYKYRGYQNIIIYTYYRIYPKYI